MEVVIRPSQPCMTHTTVRQARVCACGRAKRATQSDPLPTPGAVSSVLEGRMRVALRSFLGAIVLLAACVVAADKPTELSHVHAPTVASSGTPDLEGLADLIVDAKTTQNHWVTRIEDLPASLCSVEEG